MKLKKKIIISIIIRYYKLVLFSNAVNYDGRVTIRIFGTLLPYHYVIYYELSIVRGTFFIPQTTIFVLVTI